MIEPTLLRPEPRAGWETGAAAERAARVLRMGERTAEERMLMDWIGCKGRRKKKG